MRKNLNYGQHQLFFIDGKTRQLTWNGKGEHQVTLIYFHPKVLYVKYLVRPYPTTTTTSSPSRTITMQVNFLRRKCMCPWKKSGDQKTLTDFFFSFPLGSFSIALKASVRLDGGIDSAFHSQEESYLLLEKFSYSNKAYSAAALTYILYVPLLV